MCKQLIGSILLISGTSIGAGMLALPVISAEEGFLTAVFLLFGCWAVMTLGAFLILEANLWFPANSNMISMAKATLGRIGQTIAWITYLFLLYSLLCAYISSISDILHAFLFKLNLNTKQWVDALIIVFIFGGIVWCGMRAVDMANRLFVSIKFIAYALLVLAIMPHVSLDKLISGNSRVYVTTITVMITSFGFSTIIPSIRVYLKGDVRKLRLAVLIGSLIPLVLYIIWLAVVHGTVPREGAYGLIQVAASDQVTTGLTAAVIHQLNSLSFATFVHAFIDVCVATSFLGVSLCLTVFLADGLQLRKKGAGGLIVYCCTFLPPIVIVLFAPGMFIKALSYAGLFCIILLIMIPLLIVWSGRYHKKLNVQGKYQVWGGKILLLLGMMISVVLLIWNIVSYF